MPGTMCSCGERISYSDIPSPNEWIIVSVKDLDAYGDTVGVDELYEKSPSVLKCSHCGRLWVYWNGFSRFPTEYVPVRRAVIVEDEGRPE